MRNRAPKDLPTGPMVRHVDADRAQADLYHFTLDPAGVAALQDYLTRDFPAGRLSDGTPAVVEVAMARLLGRELRVIVEHGRPRYPPEL